MLNDARVASLGFFKDNICTTGINKEKKFKIKFQVLQKFALILLDYSDICLRRRKHKGQDREDETQGYMMNIR